MIVKAIYKDKTYNYFRDEETNDKRVFGDVFECSDELAEKRIEKKLVKEASKKEKEEYLKQQELEKNKDKEESEEEVKDEETNDDQTVKSLEDCTIEELLQIGVDENIELVYPRDETAKEVIIKIITDVRAERLEQPDNV